MTDFLTSEATPRIVSTGQSFDIGSNHYGPEWLGVASAQALIDAGLRTVAYVGSPLNTIYYTNTHSAPVIVGNTATITWVNTPLSLATVKAAKLIDLNNYALVRDMAG